MCGRTCCTLDPRQIPLACSTVLPDCQIPRWIDAPCGGQYVPCTNIPPTAYTPILISGEKVGLKEDPFVVQPMMWGLIPFWHRGDNPKEHGLTTNNARIEGLNDSRLYKKAVQQNRRCVVICDGFYEWKVLKTNAKQPYLIYARQDSIKDESKLGSLGELLLSDDEQKWNGPRPLFMAGLFSSWKKSSGDKSEKAVYTYSVITRESNKAMDWIHERMPAFLPDADAVQRWLDPKIQPFEAIKQLEPIREDQISFHPVSGDVGNVRNKGTGLAKRVELNKSGTAMKKEAGLMSKWLSNANKKKNSQDDDEKDFKRIKIE